MPAASPTRTPGRSRRLSGGRCDRGAQRREPSTRASSTGPTTTASAGSSTGRRLRPGGGDRAARRPGRPRAATPRGPLRIWSAGGAGEDRSPQFAGGEDGARSEPQAPLKPRALRDAACADPNSQKERVRSGRPASATVTRTAKFVRRRSGATSRARLTSTERNRRRRIRSSCPVQRRVVARSLTGSAASRRSASNRLVTPASM